MRIKINCLSKDAERPVTRKIAATWIRRRIFPWYSSHTYDLYLLLCYNQGVFLGLQLSISIL